MAKKHAKIMIEHFPGELHIWSDLDEEQVTAIEGVNSAISDGALIYAYLDPRYSPEEIDAEIRTLALAEAKAEQASHRASYHEMFCKAAETLVDWLKTDSTEQGEE